MTRIIQLTILFFLTLNSVNSMDVSVQAHVFRTAESPYVELSLYVLGASMTPIMQDSLMYSQMEVLITIRKQGEGIVAADKYRLSSPIARFQSNFLDVRRFALPNGSYVATFELTDLADSLNTSSISNAFLIEFDGEQLSQSDVQLLATARKSDSEGTMVKNGLYMEPLPFGYYHRDLDQLTLYNEIYNATSLPEDRYFVTFRVASESRPEIPILETHKLVEPASTIPLIKQIEITDLPSGNYIATVGLYNSAKSLIIEKEVGFQRSNPERDVRAFGETAKSTIASSFTKDIPKDSLRYCLKAIAPVIPQTDVDVLNYLLKDGSVEGKRFFLHRYWTSQNELQPKTVYEAYMEVARAIDGMYNNGFGYGFETDRGHLYLKYGRPDDIITVTDEPSAPPYEIWFYNHFEPTHQANVRFIFYNPTLVDNDFRLLHSTAIGEINNPRWEVDLYGDAPTQVQGTNFVNGTRMQDNMGRNARRYFEGN